MASSYNKQILRKNATLFMKAVIILLQTQLLYHLQSALFAQGTKLFDIFDSFQRLTLHIDSNVYQNDALKFESASVFSLVFEVTEIYFCF